MARSTYHILVNVHLKDDRILTNSVMVIMKSNINVVIRTIYETGFDDPKRWSENVDHLEVTGVVDCYFEPVKFAWGTFSK